MLDLIKDFLDNEEYFLEKNTDWGAINHGGNQYKRGEYNGKKQLLEEIKDYISKIEQ